MKTNEQLLRDFIKANKERKASIVAKAGFDTPEQYKEYLVTLINGAITPSGGGTISSVKPTIHLVDLLDSSASMGGGKYENATRGVREGLKEFRNETEVNYTYSLVEFVEYRNIIEHQYIGSLNLNPSFYGAHGGDTPLYRTIYNTLTKVKNLVAPTDKVLVKIYTDGLNNTAYSHAPLARKLIAELSDTFTVTLVGPERELKQAVTDLGLDDSNTLAVENNARGFQMAFTESIGATRSYAKKVSLKQDVKTEFYSKKVGKL
ncbi:MAG TPA: hypothetical protein VLE44_02345 [Candidatus Saccharimonadales bacterium]|nr:hypothetical protein [Candidatus Saccharimonadales bacterium]